MVTISRELKAFYILMMTGVETALYNHEASLKVRQLSCRISFLIDRNAPDVTLLAKNRGERERENKLFFIRINGLHYSFSS